MSVGYRFTIHNGPTVEARGAAAFDDDADAFSFAKDVISDLRHAGAARSAGFTMRITQDQRAVGSIPFMGRL